MGYNETSWQNEYNLNKPKFYLRYVDNILVVFDNEKDLKSLIFMLLFVFFVTNLKSLFLICLNKKHPDIKYTIEQQINYSITFLDVLISVINYQNLTVQMSHKSCYTGLYWRPYITSCDYPFGKLANEKSL